MWSDSFFGLCCAPTMELWRRAANEGHDFGTSSRHLKDYFDLT
jgi:hypothetical protein